MACKPLNPAPPLRRGLFYCLSSRFCTDKCTGNCDGFRKRSHHQAKQLR
nr:MAG TPA: hypothetical protein [Caudoviricetes sp.]